MATTYATNTNSRRNSGEPFVFQLPEPYQLSRQTLMEQTHAAFKKSSHWSFLKITVLDFEKGRLLLKVTQQKQQQQITLQVEPYTISVQCNCNSSVTTVCMHAFHMLNEVSPGFFKQYRADGLCERQRQFPNYFTKNSYHDTIPRQHMGTIYSLLKDDAGSLPAQLVSCPAAAITTPATPANETLCFFIAGTFRMRNILRHHKLPGFVPCMGKLNKAGNNVKGFHKILSGLSKEERSVLPIEQQQLVNTGVKCWKLIEKLPGTLANLTEDETPMALQLFQLWEQVLPMLCKQQHVYSYPQIILQRLKQKTAQRYLRSCSLEQERPELSFVLEQKTGYRFLYAVVSIRSKEYKKFDAADSFFIMIDNRYYLAASLRDALLLEWMYSMKYGISVFREQWAQFETTVLQPLKQLYEVKIKG